MTYALPNSTLNLTYVDVMQWANNTTEGAMAYGMLLIIFMLILMGTRKYSNDLARCFFASFFGTFMFGWTLVWMGLLTPLVNWLIGVAMMFSYIFIDHS